MNREIAPGIHWIYEAGPDRAERFDLAERRPEWYEPGREARSNRSVLSGPAS